MLTKLVRCGVGRAAAQVEAELEARAARLAGMVRGEDGKIVSGEQQAAEGRRVYVGGMPFSYDQDTIHSFWEYCGEVAPPRSPPPLPHPLTPRLPAPA